MKRLQKPLSVQDIENLLDGPVQVYSTELKRVSSVLYFHQRYQEALRTRILYGSFTFDYCHLYLPTHMIHCDLSPQYEKYSKAYL